MPIIQEKWIQRGASSHELRKGRKNKQGQVDVSESKIASIQEDLTSCVCSSSGFTVK